MKLDNSGKNKPMAPNLGSVWVKTNGGTATAKSILITGLPRGGTSLAASIFVHIGVPFCRPAELENAQTAVTLRYEHKNLRGLLAKKDFESIRRVSREFVDELGVWAWKLPAIFKNLNAISEAVSSPHFVIVFKEPMSVAMRARGFREDKVSLAQSLQNVLKNYLQLAQFARETHHPVMLLSYDKAMANLPATIRDCAQFAGTKCEDPDSLVSLIAEDGRNYFARTFDRGAAPDILERNRALWGRKAEPQELLAISSPSIS